MNQEFPPWLVRDPRANKSRARTHCKIEKDEVLLAVIHGYGTNDWRDPEATQTFVLKNVVGNDLKVHTGKEFVTANSGQKVTAPAGRLDRQKLFRALRVIFTTRQPPIRGTTRRHSRATETARRVS